MGSEPTGLLTGCMVEKSLANVCEGGFVVADDGLQKWSANWIDEQWM
jgi:hypothetical protein